MSEPVSRRAFLTKSALLTAAVSVLPHARVLGANDDIRIAVIGFRSKGMQHIGVFKKMAGVRVVALCDVDSNVVKEALEKHFKDSPEQPKTYTDVRKLLEDKDIDAVCIAAPNHWHSPMAIWACEAGKDVYVEKPVSHTIWEGQQLVAAAKKYNRIVQVGMQSRSDDGLKEAFQFIKDDKIGPIEFVRAFYYNLREPIGKVSGPQQPPPEVDYNLWLGPAADEPLMRKNLHYDWHWQWKYGNGELGNNGVHTLDLCCSLLGKTEFPERVVSIGGRFVVDDDGQTANTHITWYDFKPIPVYFELRNQPHAKGDPAMDHISGCRVGLQVKCRDGYFAGFSTGGWVYDNDGKRVQQFKSDGGGGHHQNFIDAVRGRKPEMIAATPSHGHIAAGLCHLGNISHRLGQAAEGAEISTAVKGVPQLEDGFARMQEHLLLNQVDVKKTPRMLGPWLTIDPKTERFTGDRADEANAMLKKPYRQGFEIKEIS
jgi:predicted dehydrogenase